MSRKQFIINITVIQAMLAILLWQGWEAATATNHLPRLAYPELAATLNAAAVNPQAINALHSIHTMDGVPPGYQNLEIQMHTAAAPMLEYLEIAIQRRGGISRRQCDYNDVPQHHYCRLNAAVPASMYQELLSLQQADFQSTQQWIKEQSTNAGWQHANNGEASLTLTNITLVKAKAKAFGMEYPHDHATTLGQTALLIGILLTIIMIALAGLLVVEPTIGAETAVASETHPD